MMSTDTTPAAAESVVLDKATVVAFLDEDDGLHQHAYEVVAEFGSDGFHIVVPANVVMELFADAAMGGSDMVWALSGFVRTCVDDVHAITAAIAADAAEYTARMPDLPLDLAVPLAVARAIDSDCFVTTADRDWSPFAVRVVVVGHHFA